MNPKAKVNTILTHPGRAHKDEFLACSVLVAFYEVPIIRRDPTEIDLRTPSTCVVDVGGEHDGIANNFDHHQFPKEHPPTCSLSLILQDLGFYKQAKEFCDWLELTEWLDSRGAFDTAKWLDIPASVITRLNSPIDITLLRRFALQTHLVPGDIIWEMMRMIGQDLLDYIKNIESRIAYVEKNSELWTLQENSHCFGVLYLPRREGALPNDASSGIEFFISRQGKGSVIAALIYPDRRGEGYSLCRFNDDPRLDFSLIGREPDVHFAHSRGFIAKTKATDSKRLKELICQSIINPF